MRYGHILAATVLALAARHAQADEHTNEDRLRDALRQAVTQMRAAQDQAAQATADAQKAQSAQAAVQAQLDAANAQLASLKGKPAAPAADVQAMQEALKSYQAQSAQMQQALAKWQAAYNTAAGVARTKDEESQRATAGLQADVKALDTCKAENVKLIDTAESILHLYQTQSFRSILLRSYEPIIGSAKVTLENTVQDYDDRIHDQEYVPPAAR
jgi:chromosome segregation ATPase